MNVEKIQKALGPETIDEMDRLTEDELRRTIVQSHSSIDQGADELDSNPHYAEARLQVSDLSAGFREVKKRQSAKIKYALHRLREIGKSE